MGNFKLVNKRIELYRIDEVTMTKKINGKTVNIKLKVASINGVVEEWNGATKKDISLLSKYRKQEGVSWDTDILHKLNSIIPQPKIYCLKLISK